jgi:hypothetical protein
VTRVVAALLAAALPLAGLLSLLLRLRVKGRQNAIDAYVLFALP